jgi:hypothetical protein
MNNQRVSQQIDSGTNHSSALLIPQLHKWRRGPIRKTLKESWEITEKIQETESAMCTKCRFDLVQWFIAKNPCRRLLF